MSTTNSSASCTWTSTSGTSATASYTLATGDGTKTVYVWYKDSAGNQTSSYVSDTISLYSSISTIPSQSGTLTYTGSSQSPSWSNYDSNKLTLGGTTSGTNAGSYSATFTPKTNYIWSDGTTTSKTVSWSIGKTAGSLSVSPTSLTINKGQTGTITATRAGNGTVSATSSNTGVATVSVSGTTVTVTGVAAGTATITIKVAEGTNHTAPTNKTVSVTVTNPPAIGSYLLSHPTTGLNTTMEGGLYRYQGTSANNYICFGTSDKATCTGNTDAYMYRIMGINSSNQLKLIKNEALNSTDQWYSNYTTNITWPQSTVYSNINGSTFLTNSTYMPSGWSSKIATTTWKYGDNTTYDTTAASLYSTENGWTSTTSAKIGLMYMHDFYYGMSGGNNCSVSGAYTTCKTSWLFLGNCDSGAPSAHEWTMSRYGLYSTYSRYSAWRVYSTGYVSNTGLNATHAVRPVFYLTSDVQFISGTGTSSDPFIIS